MTHKCTSCRSRLIPFAPRDGIWFCRTCQRTQRLKVESAEPVLIQRSLFSDIAR